MAALAAVTVVFSPFISTFRCQARAFSPELAA
jgi:hypothetical protein